MSEGRKNRCRLSIIVPCYKVEKYLKRCLDALLSQTLDGIELICINDGSPDGCLNILKEYKNRHKESIVLIDKKNEGVWKARKDGIAAACGEYIGFADPDDHVEKDFAARLYRAAKENDADIACCGFCRKDEDTGRVHSMEMTDFRPGTFDFTKEPGLLLEVNIALWNKIFRADLLKGMGDTKLVPKIFDDLIFAQLIYINARKFAFVSDPLIYYTVRKDSIISSLKPEYVVQVYASMKELREIYTRDAPGLLPYLDAEAFLHLGVSLMHRQSLNRQIDLKAALSENRSVLNQAFPLWARNPCIRLSYVIRHRGANLRLVIVHSIYRLRLFGLFLIVYRTMTERFGIEKKW